ncbi:ferredoxin [Micromonospora sp. NPDC049559]|uniref:ferredoxin n=1 Tax=Micromonospora sp. NPDC049559 TaxID=3155923 RepID=UPI00341C2332
MTGDGRVLVDPERCVGAGQCVMYAPDVFDQTEEGVVRLRGPRVDPDEWPDVVEAVARCPVGAIALPAG